MDEREVGETLVRMTVEYRVDAAGSSIVWRETGPCAFLPAPIADADEETRLQWLNEHLESAYADMLYGTDGELVEVVIRSASEAKVAVYDDAWDEPWHARMQAALDLVGRPERLVCAMTCLGPVTSIEA